jgi:hypothetical protein
MSGGPGIVAGGSGSNAVTAPDADATKAPAAKSDKSLPAVSPGILSDAELGILRNNAAHLDDSVYYLEEVGKKAWNYGGLGPRGSDSKTFDRDATIEQRISAAKGGDVAVQVAGDGVEGAYNKFRADRNKIFADHLRGAGAALEERARAIYLKIYPYENPEDVIETVTKMLNEMGAETRAAVVIAKVSSLGNPKFNEKLKTIDKNFKETAFMLAWLNGAALRNVTSIRWSVENPPEVRDAIRKNPEYKEIVDGAARAWIASGKRPEDRLALEPDINTDFEAAVAKIERSIERSQVPKHSR